MQYGTVTFHCAMKYLARVSTRHSCRIKRDVTLGPMTRTVSKILKKSHFLGKFKRSKTNFKEAET